MWRSLDSAFDWGSKGREFKSLHPDHFFRFHPLRLLIEAVFILTQIPLNTKVLQIPLPNVIPPENFTFSPFLTPSGTIVGQFSEGERSAAFGLSELSVNIRHKSLTNNFPDKMSRSSSYSHYLVGGIQSSIFLIFQQRIFQPCRLPGC